MNKVIKISNITVVENTVVISLDRYNELVSKEKKVNENTVYTKRSWGWSTSDENVFTNDEAVKELSNELIKSREETRKLEEEKNVLVTHNKELLKIKKDYSWKEIFLIIKNKFSFKKII